VEPPAPPAPEVLVRRVRIGIVEDGATVLDLPQEDAAFCSVEMTGAYGPPVICVCGVVPVGSLKSASGLRLPFGFSRR
jgi:hypothetical protein